jgi:hypothetical protein
MIRLMLLAYPRSWRLRYGDELVDLLAATGIGPSVAFDVLRAGIRERGHALGAAVTEGDPMSFGPAWRHPMGWGLAAGIVLVPTGAFVVLSVLAYELGLTDLRSFMEPLNGWLQAVGPADLALVLAPLLALSLAIAPLVRLELRRRDGRLEASIAVRLRSLNVVVAAAALALGGTLIWHILGESVLQQGA